MKNKIVILLVCGLIISSCDTNNDSLVQKLQGKLDSCKMERDQLRLENTAHVLFHDNVMADSQGIREAIAFCDERFKHKVKQRSPDLLQPIIDSNYFYIRKASEKFLKSLDASHDVFMEKTKTPSSYSVEDATGNVLDE